MKLVRRGRLRPGPCALASAPLPRRGAAGGGRQGRLHQLAQAVLAATPGYAQAESTFTKEVAGLPRRSAEAAGRSSIRPAQDFEQQSVMLSPTRGGASGRSSRPSRSGWSSEPQELQRARRSPRERELLEPIQQQGQRRHRGDPGRGQLRHDLRRERANSGIVAADKSLDLTDKVIEQLKAEHLSR